MTRLNPVSRSTANEKTTQLLNSVEKKLGLVPNMIATMAQSDAVANAYLGFSSALSRGKLSAQVREQIALAVGQKNDCDYCVAAHSAIGSHAGLDADALVSARQGQANDPKTEAVLRFAVQVVEKQGRVADEDVKALKDHGLSEGEIAEVVANVALNLFTNYFNHVADTEIDFPAAAELPLPAA